MTQIVIGTTPTITYTFKTVSPPDLTKAILTIKCAGQIILEKTIADAVVGENSLSWTLTQQETLDIGTRRGKMMLNWLPTAVKAGCANYQVKYTDEWCATCASYAYISCGLGHLFPVECSCPRMITLAKSMGIWQENDGYVPDSADAVLYDWEDSGKGDNAGTPDHIGIVIAVDKNKGTFVDTEGNEKAVKNAVSRGVWVYGYLNIGALEKQRPYCEKLKHLRLAKYEGWDGVGIKLISV